LFDTAVDVAVTGKVKAVKAVPDGAALPFTETDGRVGFVVPSFTGHAMVEIAY
jgi:hypothetical protein